MILEFQPDRSCASSLKSEAIRNPKGEGKEDPLLYFILVKLDTTLTIAASMRLKLRGFFLKDDKYGWQFKALAANASNEKNKDDQTLGALAAVRGNNGAPLIGRERLKRLKKALAATLPEVLKDNPSKLCEVLPDLTEQDALRLGKAWTETQVVNDDAAAKKLQELPEIGPVLARAIITEFGDQALNTMLRDPYEVAHRVRGIGFVTAEKIAELQNLPPMVRARGRIDHLLRSAAEENGDCGVRKADLVQKVADATKLEPKHVEGILAGLVAGKHAPYFEEDDVIWHRSFVHAEQKVATWIEKTLSKPAVHEHRGAPSLELSKEQGAAMQAILEAPVSILTGGPGTGKTTLLSEIASRTSCLLCAPTGRAAKRLTEVTGADAMTLHRLILQKSNPVRSEHLLIVDECSMADIMVMSALAERCAERLPRLLFVGDANQLPSVAAGQVFRDLIACGRIPVHRLTENFRTVGAGGGIVAAAEAVLRGKMPRPTEFDAAKGFCFVETASAAEAAAKAVEFATEILPQHCKLDPVGDLQVLTPMRGGPAGVQALNAELRPRLNPSSPGTPFPFSPGERVINLQNQPDRGIFNGDLGVIESINQDRKEATVRFQDLTVLFDEKRLCLLELAYAITAHKAQGSEYPAVIVVLAKGHYVLLDRNLLYTAMTRAQKQLIIVAERGALAIALKNATRDRRTRLAKVIADGQA